MNVNTSFKTENDHCNIENECGISQYKESKYNNVAKIDSHKGQCKGDEYDDVLTVEQHVYEPLQIEQKSQRCRVSLYKNLFIVKTVRK